MHALERRFGTRGLRVVSVTKHGEDEEEKARVAEVAKKHALTAPIFLDVDGAWSKASGLGYAPSFLVVGRDGKAAYRFAGKLTEGTEDYEQLASAIERSLGGG